jgi:fructose-1,6-bisphosphatase/inositol monophosphatase family enzyme
VDPLDGTLNYVNGDLPGVCSLIGIALDGRPVLGVVHHPFVEGSPTYFGGPGMPIYRTLDSFADQGEPIEIPRIEEITIQTTKNQMSPYISNFLARLPYRSEIIGGAG